MMDQHSEWMWERVERLAIWNDDHEAGAMWVRAQERRGLSTTEPCEAKNVCGGTTEQPLWEIFLTNGARGSKHGRINRWLNANGCEAVWAMYDGWWGRSGQGICCDEG